MRPIERVNLIGKIANILQQDMTYSRIDAYLPAFGIACPDHHFDINFSKRLYVEKLLSDQSDEVILKIADDLELEHLERAKVNIIPTFWKQGYFKLFISHVAKFKEKASELQNALKIYGISSFVAHSDIEPSREWLDEIEKALHTMDALTAILLDGFKESSWCDQEVGFAVGKSVLIIPIKKDLDPYGFIGKYQSIHADGKKSVADIAKEVFITIVKNPKTSNQMLTIFTNLIGNSTHEETAIKQLNILCDIETIPKEILIQMAEQIKNNSVLIKSTKFIDKTKLLLKKYDIQTLENKESMLPWIDIDEDEIPF